MKLTDADNAADGIFFPALEQNMMGAVLINENDEVMFFNPAAEKLWGYKREEVIGNNIDMLIPRDLRPAHPEYIRHNREGGKARVEGMSRELQLEKKDGSKIWTRFALSKVSAEGKVYYLALVRDASVEMAQKEQTRQLIIAVDHLDRPVIVLDPERHIVQCNRAFTEMFGYCISEASGMQPDTLLNIPEFPADNRIRLQQLLWKTARDQDEFLLLTRTGEKIWIKASISPVYDVLAHLQNLVMTFSDITEERQIRQLEGNILAAMCSSPPFHEMGEIICRNIESVLNDYIRTARASGLPGWYIVLCYALPNALIPSITVLGLALGDLLYGAVLTETVFAWPGMGAWVVTSIQALDFPAVMGFAVVVSFAYVLVNLVVDLLYLWIDPRIGRGGGE